MTVGLKVKALNASLKAGECAADLRALWTSAEPPAPSALAMATAIGKDDHRGLEAALKAWRGRSEGLDENLDAATVEWLLECAQKTSRPQHGQRVLLALAAKLGVARLVHDMARAARQGKDALVKAYAPYARALKADLRPVMDAALEHPATWFDQDAASRLAIHTLLLPWVDFEKPYPTQKTQSEHVLFTLIAQRHRPEFTAVTLRLALPRLEAARALLEISEVDYARHARRLAPELRHLSARSAAQLQQACQKRAQGLAASSPLRQRLESVLAHLAKHGPSLVPSAPGQGSPSSASEVVQVRGLDLADPAAVQAYLASGTGPLAPGLG